MAPIWVLLKRIMSGVGRARAEGASHVLLFDQDSAPDADMIACLRDGVGRWSGAALAAIGPIYTDVKGGEGFFVKKKWLGLERIYSGSGDLLCVDHLISSGTLIPMKVMDDVGGFRSELFIDYVDTEWCLRARSRGYAVVGSFSAHMKHDLGDVFIHVMGREVPLHSPLRNYYMLRNGVWLIRQPWVGWQWRFIDSIRLFKTFLVFAFFHPQRGESIRMMMAGLMDALRGRMGPYRG